MDIFQKITKKGVVKLLQPLFTCFLVAPTGIEPVFHA